MSEEQEGKFEWGEAGKQIKISEDGLTLSKTSFNGWQTAYSRQSFSPGKYKSDRLLFRFKISFSNHLQIRFGFTNSTYYKKTHFCRGNSKTNENGACIYAFDGENGRIFSHKTDNEWKYPFKSETKTNKSRINRSDVIILELNFFDRNIRYYKNGILIGTLFRKIDISDDIEYYFAVSMVDMQDSITFEELMILHGDDDGLPLDILSNHDNNDINNNNNNNENKVRSRTLSLGVPDYSPNNSPLGTKQNTESFDQDQNRIQKVHSMSIGGRASFTTHRMAQQAGKQRHKTFSKILEFIFNLFIIFWCVGVCCCRKTGKEKKAGGTDSIASYRSILYTTVVFAYAWLYFIGAIFLVPYTAQMALNSLATATAVAIFIKRKELSIKHFRILTGIFTPIVLFMSSYAAWNLRDTVSQDLIDDSPPVKLRGLALFLAFIDGVWIILSTFYIVIIDDEIVSVYKEANKANKGISSEKENNIKYNKKGGKKEFSLVWINNMVTKIGPLQGEFGSVIYETHIIFGCLYILFMIIFTRVNEMFLLEVVSYGIMCVLGAVIYQYVGSIHTRNLAAIEMCTQLFIMFLGISGTRLLYALLGGVDFSNIFVLPGRIVAVTFLCWGYLFYRTLEVVEWNFSHADDIFLD